MVMERSIAWLDNKYKEFNNTVDGRKRAWVLQKMREGGFLEDVTTLIELWYAQRYEYLAAVGVKGSDVLFSDEDQKEYYLTEEENGNPGEEGYSVDSKVSFLPEYLDVEHWANYTYPYTSEMRTKLELND